ncbi:unnamed protein product [Hermetia illucens]|uniref:Uncharacterized protein n=1 Tax=Hermetia illucens TaxID=343691 RepID=A0A7R8Z0T9_HERIL|nr:unnamed protein product [Hermetia illucens]
MFLDHTYKVLLIFGGRFRCRSLIYDLFWNPLKVVVTRRPAVKDYSSVEKCTKIDDLQKTQARNKPADGSGHLNPKSGQRDKTPAPGQKGGAPTKATAHTAKQPVPAKQAAAGNNKQNATPKQSSAQATPKPAAAAAKIQKKPKKKHQQHDLVVTIDLVSTSTIDKY